MKRLMLVAAGVALATVPAVLGLTHNPALSHSVPVRILSGAAAVTGTPIDPFVKPTMAPSRAASTATAPSRPSAPLARGLR